MSTQPKAPLTADEYLAIERQAERKSEYYAGEMFAISGASYRHNKISANISVYLGVVLKNRNCDVLTSDMRVSTDPRRHYAYPDLLVVCGEPKFLDDEFDTLLDPAVIVEILSPTTRDYDRGLKFELYRNAASLKDYLLVAQDRIHVEHYSRQPEGTWVLWETNDLSASVALPSLDVELPLSDIYARIDFN